MRPAGEATPRSLEDDPFDLHAVPPPLDVVAGPRAAVFVGRERELSTLTAELASATRGDGRLVLITGDAGIGKTRLVRKLAVAARSQGFEVAWGSADEDEAPAYWSWTQMIRSWMAGDVAASPSLDLRPDRLCGEGSAGPSREDRFRLHDTFVRAVRERAVRHPLLLVLDDLHWADAGSLALLRAFATQLDDARLVLVATLRAGAAASERLAGTLAAVARMPGTRHLTVRGLDEQAVGRWVTEVTGRTDPAVVASIARRSAGNAFFVSELVRLLEEGGLEDAAGTSVIPDGVRAVVRRRIAGVSPACASLLRALAVAGNEVSLPLVQVLVELPGPSLLALLAEASDAGFLVARPGQPGVWTFTHDLIHETLYDELDGSARIRLHAAVGQALAARHAGSREAPAATIARHFFLAAASGCADRALRWAVRAAAQANARWAWEDAARHFESALHALELTAPEDVRQRAEVLLARGAALARAGDGVAARRSVSAAVDLAIRLAGPGLLVRAALQLRGGQFSLTLAGDVEHVRVLEAALAAIPADHPLSRARVLTKLALERLAAGDPLAHAALSAEALALARAGRDPAGIAAAGTGRHWGLLGTVDLAERRALARESLRAARSAGDRENIASAMFQLLADLVESGDLRAARRLLHDPRLGKRVPIDVEYWRTVLHGFETLLRGKFDETEEAMAAVAALAPRLRPDHDAVAVLFGQRSVLRRDQGRLGEMEPVMSLQVDPNPRRLLSEVGLALLHAQVGRTAEARTALDRLVTRDLDRLVPDAFCLPTVAMLAELSALLRDRDAARAVASRLAPYGTRAVVFGHIAAYWGCSAMYLGLLAGTLGRVDEAEEQFARALDFDEALGASPWMARTRCHWAEVLLACDRPGDRDRARTMAMAAVDVAERLGMPVVRERAAGLELAARGHAAEAASGVPAGTGTFVCDGDVWTLGWEGQVTHMGDTKGLRYLARLLAHEGEPLHALALVAESVDASPVGPIDAAAAERARSAVSQRIRGAVRGISRRLPGLAEHLRIRVRTGTRCTYLHDPSRPVRWIA